MSAGGGKSKASSQQGLPKDLVKIIKDFYQSTMPLREEWQTQAMQALQGGTPASTLPIISSAVEQSKQATSRTLKGLDEDLARYGLAGTPFGERTRTETRLSGAQQTSQIPSNILTQLFLSQIPGYSTGSASSVMGSLGAGRTASSDSKAMDFFGAAKK